MSLILNEKNIKKEQISAHGGKGLMDIRFAFKNYQHWGNSNDSQWNCFAVGELPVGATAGYHKHEDTDEIFYIINGEATITIDKESQKIKKGDIILTRMGSSHEITKVRKKLKFIIVEIFRKS